MVKKITQKVSIEPKYLDSDINNHIFNKLKKNMEGTCTLDNGYIISVNKLINVRDNKIGCANSVIFDVTYEVDMLKPTKGQILFGKVCMVFAHGIFVVCETMKVLVPATTMTAYTWQPDENIFKSATKSIKNNVDISIEIVMTKYEKKQFSCIGKLHEEESESDESETEESESDESDTE